MDTTALHAAIQAVCPINGVSVGQPSDKTTWRIDFADTATPAQQTAAQSVVASFDPNAVPDPLSAWDVVTLKVCFNHENRIRALEGRVAVTAAQFKTAIRNLATPT